MTKPARFPKIDLNVSDLSCERGGRPVLSGVKFNLSSGQGMLLKGPNGAGKSSLLLGLAGLIHVDGIVNWHIETAPDIEIAHLMHFVGHQHAIKPELTLSENLQFWADMLGGQRNGIEPALEQAGLAGLGHFAARNLSAGQTHRLSLCRLLVAPRPVWLLDEPSSALDISGDQWVAGLIGSHLGCGGLAVVTTHRDIPLATDLDLASHTLGERS